MIKNIMKYSAPAPRKETPSKTALPNIVMFF
jgi:hypothetical protein